MPATGKAGAEMDANAVGFAGGAAAVFGDSGWHCGWGALDARVTRVPRVIGLIGSGRLTITRPDRGNQAGMIGASNLHKARMIVGCVTP